MITAILLYLAVLFLLEVLLGSSTGVYNAEIGIPARAEYLTKFSTKKFFRQLLPVCLLCTGGIYFLLHLVIFY